MDNHALSIRRAIITALKDDPAITALVGDGIYTGVVTQPAWPFIRYGFPISEPIYASGWNLDAFELTLHVFSKGEDEQEVTRIAALVVNRLHEADLTLDMAGGLLMLQRTGFQLLPDVANEGSAYHAVLNFAAVTGEITEEPQVAASETAIDWTDASVQMLAANAARKGIWVENESDFDAYVREGADAAGTAAGQYNYIIRSRTNWQMPHPIYTGPLQVIFAGAAGSGGLNVTERTGA